MGPLTLADFVGLDTLGSICDVLLEEFRERRFACPPTLRKMLSAGWFGRKSGTGFYDYSGGSRSRTRRCRDAIPRARLPRIGDEASIDLHRYERPVEACASRTPSASS